ncbi:MAG: branched-chain amino acid transport system permease protein [Candidatus Peregrinibacteria bacterium Gr01-1014_25]|nr:MAG: branched-chain amino acid transport system permease protein [Candidatus Peregrinibacteria bacterium Gr01-1014_25]
MSQLVLNALIAGSLAALIAGGLALVYGVMGIFNMALGQMALFGGYMTWWFRVSLGQSLPVSILLGLCCGALLSWLTFRVFVEPFVRYHRWLPIVTTIAWGMILDGLILLLFQERPASILPGLESPVRILGGQLTMSQITLILATLSLLAIFAVILHATAYGRRIRAVVQHPHAAMSLGIHALRLRQMLFIASGTLAAAGGIFIGIDQNLTPTLAFPLTIKAYAAVIAGGRGSLYGAILCAYVIALLEQLLVGVTWFGAYTIPAGYQSAVALFLIIGFLLVRPHGIFGSPLRTA